MKTILITGAAGGVCACLVKEYLSRGYYVMAADCTRSAAIDSLCAQAPDRFAFGQYDVSDTASVQAMRAWIGSQTDHLDILLNGAGILPAASENLLQDFDIDGARRVFDINALGPLRVVKACVDLLRRGEDKLLLNISSEAGSITTHADYVNRYDYCMSKCALNMQSVILQRYLKPDGIKVLLVHPGWVRTAMGGPQAPVMPEDSARGIAALADRYMREPGDAMYMDYDGTPRPW